MTITFSVSLATLNNMTAKQPYNQYDSGINGNFASTRSTWFPDLFINNHKLKDGNTFTAKDANAMYLKNNFTTGPYAFLSVVSTTY